MWQRIRKYVSRKRDCFKNQSCNSFSTILKLTNFVRNKTSVSKLTFKKRIFELWRIERVRGQVNRKVYRRAIATVAIGSKTRRERGKYE